MPKNASLMLRARIFLALLVVLLGLPAVLAGSWLIYQDSVKNRLELMTERAPLVVQLIENDILAKKQALLNAAMLLDVNSIEEVSQQQLDGIVQGFSGVIWAGVTDEKGTVKLAYKDLLKGANVSKRPWFKEGLQHASVLDRHDAVLLAGLLPKREEPYRFIDIAVPIKSKQGKTLGVLALHLDWIWYQQQFPSLIGDAPATSLITYAVFGKDNELRLLKASSEDEALLTPEDFSNGITMKLQDHFYFVRHTGPQKGVMDELDWTLYVMQNRDLTHDTVWSAAVFALLSFLIGLLATAFLFFRLSKNASSITSQFVDALVNKDPQFLARLKPRLPSEILPLSQKAEALISDLKQQKSAVEQALADTRNNYMEIQRLVAQAPVAIAMFDRQMNYLVCSDLWRTTYLAGIPDPIGLCHYDLIPNMPGNWKQAHQLGLQGETCSQKDDSWLDSTGQRHWLNWTVQPWTAQDGKTAGVIIITEDVSVANQAKLALAKSEERFQLAMQGSHDGLWDWNLETGELFLSPAWKSMLGYEPDELPDAFETWERLMHPEDAEAAKKVFMDSLQNPDVVQYSNTFRMAHRNGHWVSIWARGIFLRNSQGQAVRTVGTHLDRTEIEALQGQLNEAWVSAKAELASNEAKSRFLAMISHEIRNPLNSVCGFARLIEEDAQDPELQRYAHLLNQTTDSLKLLLNDLLDYAKIEAGKLEICMEPFDLALLMDGLAEGGQMLCREKQLAFEYSRRWAGNTVFAGDAGRIRQVIQNLLSNAIKFTQKGHISLRISTQVMSLNTEQVMIEVQDTGIGMSRERQDKLFKPFSQVHKDAQNQYGGTGLGLSIVKSLVEMMQGEVRCESVEGQSSKFTVVFPLAVGQLQQTEASDGRVAVQRKVLIADDSPVNLKILSAFLSKRGHQVVCAANGIEAIERLETSPFDYAILDMDMPGQNGLEVVNRIRNSNAASSKAVFACLSGHADQSTTDTALGKGFDRFFVKPVDWDEMLKFLG